MITNHLLKVVGQMQCAQSPLLDRLVYNGTERDEKALYTLLIILEKLTYEISPFSIKKLAVEISSRKPSIPVFTVALSSILQ